MFSIYRVGRTTGKNEKKRFLFRRDMANDRKRIRKVSTFPLAGADTKKIVAFPLEEGDSEIIEKYRVSLDRIGRYRNVWKTVAF